jgi:hypothetical protein
MKNRVLAVALVATAFLAGCTEPVKTSPTDAQSLVDSLSYVKSKAGVCYGVATVNRLSSSLDVAVNLLIVQVECSVVGL